MSEKTYLRRREFLNKDEGLAAMDLNVTATEDWVSVTCTISDCSRSVHLDFDVHEPKDLAKRLAKVDRLIRGFQDVRSALVEADADRRVFLATKKAKADEEA